MMMRLKGQSILVVEHEPTIARELMSEFTQAGAKVFAAEQLRDALYLAEYPALAAAVIFLIMFLALRSFATGALSIIPNIFPIALNFGIMGALDIPLNTATALISVVALGIAVDDTIHFLTEYNRKRTRNQPVRVALAEVTTEKGVALSATSIILTIGFGVLIFSNFTPTMNFGGLSAVIMITAWVGDLIVLPATILLFQNKWFPGTPQSR